jgi:hypothetical protein
MPRKPLSREQKLLRREKPLGITLAELKIEIDASGGDLRKRVHLKRHPGLLRLMIRCKYKNLPQSWGMSLILDNSMIDCVHFHNSNYVNTEGFKKVGWHRDLMESGKNVGRKTLTDFDPQALDDFLLRVPKMFKVTLKPGGEDASGQLPID